MVWSRQGLGGDETMSMSLKLGIRPEMQLSARQIVTLRLLAEPLAQLEAEIDDALEDNEFLLRADASPSSQDDLQDSRPAPESRSEAASGDSEVETPGVDEMPYRERTPVSTEAREPLSVENFPSEGPSLADHLLAQLGLAVRDESVRVAGEAIIWHLDEIGYLRADLAELARGARVSLYTAERALAFVQTFDPSGVAARDLKECLRLQLLSEATPDPIALAVVAHHCAELAHRRYEHIARALGVPVERIVAAADKIRRLDPKPGRAFGASDARTVKPEIVVERIDGEYRVTLADHGLPTLRVARAYRGARERLSAEERRFATERRRAAQWFVEAIEQRRHTLLSVVETVVKLQRDFFDDRRAAVRPLSLRRISEVLGVHESTISRAISGKYVDTPHGVFPLKHFFPPGVRDADGGLVATAAVKAALRRLIDEEDRRRPMSDLALAVALQRLGFPVARRTVAKYRDDCAIPPRHRRQAEASSVIRSPGPAADRSQPPR